MSRSTPVAFAVLLLAALLGNDPATARAAAPAECSSEVHADIDGGGPDVVVGLPSYDLPGKPDASAIVVLLVGSVVDAGMVTMTRIERFGTPATGAQPRAWSQDSAGVTGVPERGDRFGAMASAVELTALEDDDDVLWAVNLVTVPGEDLGSVTDAGMAYLGFTPGKGSVALVPPVAQTGAGLSMVPMQVG